MAVWFGAHRSVHSINLITPASPLRALVRALRRDVVMNTGMLFMLTIFVLMVK